MHKPAPAWPNPISITCAAPASDLLLHQAAITAASGASPLRGEIPLPALPQQGLEGSWGGSEDLCTPRGSLWCSFLPSLSAGLRVLCLSDGKGDMGLAQNHRKKPRFLQFSWQTRLWGLLPRLPRTPASCRGERGGHSLQTLLTRGQQPHSLWGTKLRARREPCAHHLLHGSSPQTHFPLAPSPPWAHRPHPIPHQHPPATGTPTPAQPPATFWGKKQHPQDPK